MAHCALDLARDHAPKKCTLLFFFWGVGVGGYLGNQSETKITVILIQSPLVRRVGFNLNSKMLWFQVLT